MSNIVPLAQVSSVEPKKPARNLKADCDQIFDARPDAMTKTMKSDMLAMYTML